MGGGNAITLVLSSLFVQICVESRNTATEVRTIVQTAVEQSDMQRHILGNSRGNLMRGESRAWGSKPST